MSRHAHRRARPAVLLAVGAGGCLGAVARYEVIRVLAGPANGFPWGTLWVNVSGAFVLGLVMALILERFPPTVYLRPFVATGLIGGYTTYSTFAVDTDLLIKNGRVGTALLYAAVVVLAGFVAVWSAMWVARAVPIPSRGGKT